jgi:hypothetical protein
MPSRYPNQIICPKSKIRQNSRQNAKSCCHTNQ